MKKTVKSFAALFLCVSTLCLFCACAIPSDEDYGSNESGALATKESDSPAPVTEQTPSVADGEGSLGDYYIKIVSAAKAKDYSGTEVLVVTYEWTNNGDDAAMFSSAFTAKAYQNGIECTTAYMVDGVDAEKALTQIKPGATLEVQEAYKLNDNSDVSVEVTKWISFDDAVVTKIFTLG